MSLAGSVWLRGMVSSVSLRAVDVVAALKGHPPAKAGHRSLAARMSMPSAPATGQAEDALASSADRGMASGATLGDFDGELSDGIARSLSCHICRHERSRP